MTRADEDQLAAELLRLVIRVIRRAMARLADEREVRFIDDLLELS